MMVPYLEHDPIRSSSSKAAKVFIVLLGLLMSTVLIIVLFPGVRSDLLPSSPDDQDGSNNSDSDSQDATPAPTIGSTRTKVPSSALCEAMGNNFRPKEDAINLIIVPSKFGGDMEAFRRQTEPLMQELQRHDVLRSNQIDQLNVWRVPLDTAGDYCHFNCNDIARLLCCEFSSALSIADECGSGFSKQIIVVHNDPTYGGSGSSAEGMATISTHESAPLVAIHELGHSIFSLGDEYVHDPFPGWKYPNCEESPLCPSWSGLVGTDCLGGACANGNRFVGVRSIMGNIFSDTQFEAVNERISCCAYLKFTSSMPAYCERFSEGLLQYCVSENLLEASAASPSFLSDSVATSRDPDHMFIEKPVRRFFRFSMLGYSWEELPQKPLPAGWFSPWELGTPSLSSIEDQIIVQAGDKILASFAASHDLEYPALLGEVDGMGYSNVISTDISFVVNAADEDALGPLQLNFESPVGGSFSISLS